MMLIKMPSENRRAMILSAAISIANRDGLAAVNFVSVARCCEVSTSPRTVRHYFGTKGNLWLCVISDGRSSPKVKHSAAKMGLDKK